ncbi:fumitremorgin C synthase [Colletotrichum spaethianum]|uniref:Fumitremorgin C synthase n=1 Tax=Colletotrichum spaethianum TaxID=700344 RepID=A0AA37LAA0_9PEZI|nr:fumitremorgin C synthase [Colletotrichum spaethianum]GKT44747.1 fumitremorgin C synthase [Colletotrichum spaethianum]
MEGLAGYRDSLLSAPLSILLPLCFVASFGLYLLVSRLRHARHRYSKLPLPPGPPRLPIVGNLFNSPFHLSWLTHYQWRQVYGPVVYFEVGGRPTVVLTTVEAAHELLNKRASNYSNRSFSYMASELVAKGYNMLFRQYDTRLRLHQRLHVPGLNTRSAMIYHPIQELESLQLLNDMLAEGKPKPGQGTGEKQTAEIVPHNPHWHFRRAPASSMSLIVWGYRLLKGQPGIEDEMDFFSNFPSAVVLRELHLIDIFNWLKHVPDCISPWKWVGDKYHESETVHHMANFRRALKHSGYNISKQIVHGVGRLNADMSESEMAWVSGTLTLANSETTMSILCWSVIAMITYPHMMHKAQAIMDEVVGRERLPVFADRAKLPYIDAMIEEVMRWRPIFPAGMNHATAEEDEYMGYRIPKGATVVASQWAITRDTDVFGADSDDFRPERWLERDDLPKTIFGYGRRLCPGRHVGREGLWIMFARLLWAFNMQAPTDPVTLKKKVIDPMAMPSLGIIVAPEPYEALFTPRGEWVEALVHKELAISEKDADNLMKKVEIAKGF